MIQNEGFARRRCVTVSKKLQNKKKLLLVAVHNGRLDYALTWYAAQKKAFFVLTITWKRISEVWAKLSLQNLIWGFYRPLVT